MTESITFDDARPSARVARSEVRRALVKSFGCQMNVYDSQRMADTLAPNGYVETATPADADLVILNTCHIREKAAEKVYSEIGRMRRLKEAAAADGRRVLIAVAGCVAQAEGAEIVRRAPAVDLVVGSQNYHRLPELLARAERDGKSDRHRVPGRRQIRSSRGAERARATRARGVTAFVTVQEGCDKFCTFCVVPYTRGAEISRPVGKILAEIERLADAGVREVTLIGQNVNAYHGDGRRPAVGLLGLIAAAPRSTASRRLRYTTSHPSDMGDDLIAAHGDVEALAPYLHLPVQSGSDRILASMNRRHTRADYLDVVTRARASAARHCALFGFHRRLSRRDRRGLRARRSISSRQGRHYASSFAFKYSPRPGTPAAEMDGQVGEAVKASRLAALQALLEQQRQAFNRASIGRRFDVLFEKPGRHDGQVIGRSPYMQAVFAEGPLAVVGAMAEVEIVAAGPIPCRAELSRQRRIRRI